MIRVLIVDDDKLALAGLRTMIPWQEHGMEIVGEAANGQKALDFLETTPVDLVMVDLAMPVMDGLTFIRECKKRHPQIRYVVMTFHETFEYVQEALRLGVIDYISKLKLESENYDEVFLRIREKMEMESSAKRDEASVEKIDENVAHLFRQPLWLCDDMCMEQLLQNLYSHALSPRDLETVVMESLVRIETQMGIRYVLTPHFRSMKDVEVFLKDYRSSALEQVQKGICATTEARLLQAADYVNQHYHSILKIEDISAVVNLSRSYLSNCFSKSMGVTLNEFIRRKRVFEAAKRIRTTKTPLVQISSEVGYENYKYFKEVFQELMGIGPHEYRAQFDI